MHWSVEQFLPDFLTRHSVAGIRLFDWVAFFVAVPLLYRGLGLLWLMFAPVQAMWRRRRGQPPQRAVHLPGPIRLLLLSIIIDSLLAVVDLPPFEQQFWTMTARILATAAVAWMLLHVNAIGERYLHRRFGGATVGDVVAILRLARRAADAMVLVVSGLVVLRYFGIDPTAALAGLGIGGIAVALAAQKTLENVIGGISIIFDKAVSVGDFLKVGDTVGTVEEIGLRSTRLRTLDRTVLTVPNSMIAGVNLETISARDKFWFHHHLALPVTTPALQLRSIVDDLRVRLREEPHIDVDSVRARVIRFGPSSIDIELFAYLLAPSWEVFLELQETLLLDALDIVERRGASIAPAHTVHVSSLTGDPRQMAVTSNT